jgi:NTP pyrophosphatase (non-canonical NTP hydrolase)
MAPTRAELLDAQPPAAPCSAELGDLTRLVQRLGDGECPWTKQQSAADILFYLRTEMIEVEEVLRKQHKRPASGPELAQDLIGELGDVLFDALLLIRVCERDQPGVSLQSVCDSANRKLQRRCAYLFDGSGVASMEDAEAAWQAAKQVERQAEAARIARLIPDFEQRDASLVCQASTVGSQAARELTLSKETATTASSHGSASTRHTGAGPQSHASVTVGTAQPYGSTRDGMCSAASADGHFNCQPANLASPVPPIPPAAHLAAPVASPGQPAHNKFSSAAVPTAANHTEDFSFASLHASAGELGGWDEGSFAGSPGRAGSAHNPEDAGVSSVGSSALCWGANATAGSHGQAVSAPNSEAGGGSNVSSGAFPARRRASGDSDEARDHGRPLGLEEWEAEFRSALDELSSDDEGDSDG